jgi:aminocarboxymuconate-semialdehyde decarboxylase
LSEQRPVIDVHAHAVLRGSLGRAGAAGPEIGADGAVPWYRIGGYFLHGVRYEGSPFMDVDRRVEEMDKHGIDQQLLSPNPLTYFTDLDAEASIAYCRAHNTDLVQMTQKYPDRLLASAQIPLQDVGAGIADLRRSVSELGMVAAYIDTDPGRTLDDSAMDPFYAALVELDVPLFVHPTSIGPGGPPADPRLRRFDLDLIVGFAYQETLAIAALIFGGVLDRHPTLDICLSHGGGAVEALSGRLARGAQLRAWSPETVKANGFDSYLRRLWFDTHMHSDRALRGLAELVGTERLVYGTNFAGWDADEPGTYPQIDGADLSGNAARLLRLA